MVTPPWGDLFNREEKIEEIFRSLKQNNILLISPRRYGKTSVMKEVMRRLSERGYLCPFLDIMYVDAPEQFLIELATPQLLMKPVQGENFSKL